MIKIFPFFGDLLRVRGSVQALALLYCTAMLPFLLSRLSCRVFVLRALASLEADLVPCVHGLERVEQHLYDGSEARPSQDHGVSPRKATPGGKGVPRMQIISDSSDNSELD